MSRSTGGRKSLLAGGRLRALTPETPERGAGEGGGGGMARESERASAAACTTQTGGSHGRVLRAPERNDRVLGWDMARGTGQDETRPAIERPSRCRVDLVAAGRNSKSRPTDPSQSLWSITPSRRACSRWMPLQTYASASDGPTGSVRAGSPIHTWPSRNRSAFQIGARALVSSIA